VKCPDDDWLGGLGARAQHGILSIGCKNRDDVRRALFETHDLLCARNVGVRTLAEISVWLGVTPAADAHEVQRATSYLVHRGYTVLPPKQ
jgi:hypothetical protein